MERKRYVDILRITAMLAVILMHSAAKCDNVVDPSTLQWQICAVVGSLTRWAVPVFVMISGALMLGKKELSIQRLFSKNILRLVVSYLFWSFIYTLLLSTLPYYPLLSFGAVNNTIWGTIKGGYYHLWFMPMIISIYVMLPILRAFIRGSRPETTRYCLLFGVGILFVYPLLNKNAFIHENFRGIFDPLSDSFWGLYVFYFLLGYYLYQAKLTRRQVHFAYLLGGIGAAATVVSVLVPAIVYHTESKEYLMSDSINVLFMCIGLFVAIRETEDRQGGKKYEKAVMKFSKYTFGIYLVHELVMSVITEPLLQSCKPAVALPILFLATSVLSYALTWMIARSKLAAKYIL